MAKEPRERFRPADLVHAFPAKRDINGHRFFTTNLEAGQAFLKGPLVLTFIEPGHNLEVMDSPPWEEDRTLIQLFGDSFRGHFFVNEYQYVLGDGFCSGFFVSLGVVDGDKRDA